MLAATCVSIFAQTPGVTRTAKTSPVIRPTARLEAAAERNAELGSTLIWNFGGREQIGWKIFIPLISHTIGANAAADSEEFAAALMRWQEQNGLGGDGTLGSETLSAMIGYWQSRRYGKSTPPQEELIKLPASEFFDPERREDLRYLERETYIAYRRMIAEAAKDLRRDLKFTRTGELAADEKFLKIISAYRSPEYQAELRRRSPGSSRAALAVNSPHSSGRALDIYVGGDPVSTKDANRQIQVQTPTYRWLVKNAHRFGFYPYFYEPWHWEYVGDRKPGK